MEEAKFASSPLADEDRKYQAAAGMLLLRLGRIFAKDAGVPCLPRKALKDVETREEV